MAIAGDGPPVILLHGFPENWRSWRRQFAALVAAGFSVWAPDMRGYNESERPRERDAYHLTHLVGDVAALVRATGQARAHIGGHDWGGLVAWTFAARHPDLVHRLVILNAPPVDIYLDKYAVRRRCFEAGTSCSSWCRTSPSGRSRRAATTLCAACSAADRRSGYVQRSGYPAICRGTVGTRRTDRSAELLSRERWPERTGVDPRIADHGGNTRHLGRPDPALGTEVLDGIERVAPGSRVHHIASAGHWVQNEAPAEVNRELVEFLSRRQ